jgi:transcriptional regulator with PAS, ATPase and Fis domain
MCKATLTEDASIMLRKCRWPGNIRQLKNVAETISALESSRMSGYDDKCVIDTAILSKYIPKEEPNLLPATTAQQKEFSDNPGEREAIIRMLLQLKQDVDYLKEVVAKAGLARTSAPAIAPPDMTVPEDISVNEDPEEQDFEEMVPEDLSIRTANMDLIEKVLRKHGGNRKAAAAELGISERTLYRKIKNIK